MFCLVIKLIMEFLRADFNNWMLNKFSKNTRTSFLKMKMHKCWKYKALKKSCLVALIWSQGF